MPKRTVYYHASHTDLPVGTTLNGPVFMAKDGQDAHDWGHLLGNPYVYEVKAEGDVEKRYQKDALSEYEYVTVSAVIVRKVGTLVGMDRSDYCDGCLAGI